MTEKETLTHLEELLSRLRIKLRWEEGDFTGGVCRFGDSQVCVVNRSLSNREKIEILCRALARLDLSNTFLLPAIRRRILESVR